MRDRKDRERDRAARKEEDERRAETDRRGEALRDLKGGRMVCILDPPRLARPDLLEIGPGWMGYEVLTERRVVV